MRNRNELGGIVLVLLLSTPGLDPIEAEASPPQVFHAGSTGAVVAVALSPSKIVVIYTDQDSTFAGYAMVGVVDGDDITFGVPQAMGSIGLSSIPVDAL